MSSPIVVIIGRPNVGKSVLFNRILGRQDAIVDDSPGITRDRHYAKADWCGRRFTIVDTGGLVPDSDEPMESAVERQAQLAVDEADVILLLVDARAGITPLDERAAEVVRQAGKRVIVVANKVDSGAQEVQAYEAAALGLGDPVMVSGLKGRGTGDLLDMIVERLPEATAEEPGGEAIKVAIIGRSNVGKSSLVNAIVGKEAVIVTDIPGTTRDAIDTRVVRQGTPFILIDTAGLRRRTKIKNDIEFYSLTRTIRSLERCDVAVVLIDAVEGISAQDSRIVSQVEAAGKGLILAFNKWDLVDTTKAPAKRYLDAARSILRFVDFAPVLFLSALTKRGVTRLMAKVAEVHASCTARVGTGELNRVVARMLEYNPPPAGPNGRPVRMFYATQTGVAPPTFVFFANYPDAVSEGYKRYLANQLRDAFGFVGTPVRVLIRGRANKRTGSRAGHRAETA